MEAGYWNRHSGCFSCCKSMDHRANRHILGKKMKGKTMKKKNLIISISAGIAACIAALLLLSLILSWIYPSKTYGEIICEPTTIFVSLLIGLVAGLESWKGDVDINSKRK